MTTINPYLMENREEALRLEIKTDPDAVRRQGHWCGIKPGLQMLDAGCGPGLTTSILHEMIQPGGTILGLDYSEERIRHAKQKYGRKPGIDFQIHDLRDPLEDMGPFDLIWARFVLEYNRLEGLDIIRNLTACLKPGGSLCLLDLDNNCLNHYGLPPEMEKILFEIINKIEQEYNFDPYSGRKLYSYLYDTGYEEIEVDLVAHHLFHGKKITEADIFNWVKKIEMAAGKAGESFEHYPGGYHAFYNDFIRFLNDPRRFTYTPLILCRGMKPLAA
jgi:SAM-dependent methyltransferase